MKNKKRVTIIACVLAVCAFFGVASAAAYDSSQDPLITWSYLRDIFKPEILDAIDERFEELYEDIYDELYDFIKEKAEEEEEPKEEPKEEDYTEIPETAPAASFSYEVVELTEGDALYAISACEIMLRAGSAYCIAPDENQGIADCTSGEEIYNNMPFTKNHYCLIPRGDGRGILAASESVFIMVRGDYTIVRK